MVEHPDDRTPEHPDDRLEFDEPFDARQWAIHGVLCAYYGNEARGAQQRVEAICARAGVPGPPANPNPDREGGALVIPGRECERAMPSGTASPGGGSVRRIRGVSAAFRTLVKYRRWALGGSLAAAAIVIFLIYLTVPGGQRESRAANPLSAPTPLGGIDAECAAATCSADLLAALVAGDADALRERDDAIQAARVELDGVKTTLAERYAAGAVPTDDPSAFQAAATALFHGWTRVFRPLRELGRLDEALADIDAALAYARGDNPAGALNPTWAYILLNDRGDVCALAGDYPAARQAYEDSIAQRFEHISREAARAPEEWQVAGRTSREAMTLPELYWRLSYLAALQGDFRLARKEHASAEACLRAYFMGVCQAAGRSLPADAHLLDAFYAAPLRFRLPRESGRQPDEIKAGALSAAQVAARYQGYIPEPTVVTYVRAHLFCEARLRRIEGDFAGASRALHEALKIQYSPVFDFMRLDFYEPLEAGRVALALGEYGTALDELRLAECSSGPIEYFYKDIDKPPIGPLPLAELRLLKAVTLLRMDPRDAQARRLLDDALAVPRRLAERMSEAQREAFVRHFQPWETLAAAAR